MVIFEKVVLPRWLYLRRWFYLDGFIGRAADDPGVVELNTRHALGVTLERAHVTPPRQPVIAQPEALREHRLPLQIKPWF